MICFSVCFRKLENTIKHYISMYTFHYLLQVQQSLLSTKSYKALQLYCKFTKICNFDVISAADLHFVFISEKTLSGNAFRHRRYVRHQVKHILRNLLATCLVKSLPFFSCTATCLWLSLTAVLQAVPMTSVFESTKSLFRFQSTV